MVLLIAFAAFCSTMLGGLFALRLRDKLHLILGFSAGAVVGVAFFDLMPESLELAGAGYQPSLIFLVMAIGFLAYLVVDRFLFIHSHAEHEDHALHARGNTGAGTLSVHSFLDGIGTGLGFQVSPVVGAVVAAAVLAHDFSDGINTVNFITKSGGDKKTAFRWLVIDALAPVIGIAVTLLFSVSQTQLGLLLALFSGFFLYIGASDLIPESHHAHPVRWTTMTTVLGALFIYVAISLAG